MKIRCLGWFIIIFALSSLILSAETIYRFNTNAETLFRAAFPLPDLNVPWLRAFGARGEGFRPRDLGDVVSANNQAIKYAGTTNYVFNGDAIESYWLSLLGSRPDPTPLICSSFFTKQNTDLVVNCCSNLILSPLHFQSVMEKAFFQRDVLQFYYIAVNCTNYCSQALDKVTSARRDLAVGYLKELLGKLTLDEKEYKRLTNIAWTIVEDSADWKENPFDLKQDYLPLHEACCSGRWYEMRFSASLNRHFNHYGGRSFIRIFASVPGWSKGQFYAFWDSIYQRYGAQVHLSPNVPSLPARSEFMLLRTFAVLLGDGSVADSKVPEEVLIRAFKNNKSSIDVDSSDYRGTYVWMYKLSRRQVLCDSKRALVRYMDDRPSFLGFYADAQDMRAAGPAIATVRFNCIGCHSLLYYGSSTVFSFERLRLSNTEQDQFGGDILAPRIGTVSRYNFGPLNKNLNMFR